jgi:AmiR/NasT family two-component response regulator
VVASKKKGALNLFSDDPGGLTEASISEAAMLTAFVSVALVAAHESRSARTLREGLESNREIGKAVGLLMAFHQIRDDEAFELLRKASQDMNLKLAEVSREVVAHHNSRE